MRSILLALFLGCCFVAQDVDTATPCVPMSTVHDSFACVCNSTYCDTLDETVTAPTGTVQIFESTRDANKRLTRRTMQFNEPGAEPQWQVNIDRQLQKHTIQGFGGSISDSTALVIGALPPQMQREIYENLYGLKGLEFTFGRVVISSSDFSARPYSYDDDHPDDFDLEFFSLQDEDYNFKIPQLKLAKEVSAHGVKWFGSSWSPPAWMKTNNMLNGTGSLKEGPGSRYWQAYADYLVRFLDEYKQNGVDMWGLTVQNEPNTWGDHPWNSCGFNSTMERDFIKYHLGPTLERAGYGPDVLKLMMLDHNRFDLPPWVDAVYRDPEAAKYVSGAAIHWYYNGDFTGELFDEVVAEFPDKFILYTEASLVDGTDTIGFGNWWMAEQYTKDIMEDITHSVMGWVDWNLALDMRGGPNWPGVSERCAPVHIDVAKGEWYKMPIFYAMGHFSKFVIPGSIHIGTSVGNKDEVHIGTFLRPDNGIAVVAINYLDQEQTVLVADPSPNRGRLIVTLSPKSFNTFLYY